MLTLFFLSGNFFNVKSHAMLTVARIFPVKHLNDAMLTAFNPQTPPAAVFWSGI